MGIESSFSAFADDPIGRLIRVHAASIAHAARYEGRRSRDADGAASDAGQCRIIVNDLQREIDRLRRGLDCVDVRLTAEPTAAADDNGLPSAGGDSYAVRSAGRKGYAPDPLGKAPPPSEDASPAPRPRPLANHFHVTNVGTLLDVLA